MSFHPLEHIDNLYDGYRRVFSVAGRRLLLLQHDGQVYLVDNICPHAGYPLADGKIINSAIRCPMHGYLFDLTSGACTYSSEGPCRALETFEPVHLDGYVGTHL